MSAEDTDADEIQEYCTKRSFTSFEIVPGVHDKIGNMIMREYVRVTAVSLVCDNRPGAYTQTIVKPDKDR